MAPRPPAHTPGTPNRALAADPAPYHRVVTAEQLRWPSIRRTSRHRPTLGSGLVPGAVWLLNRCLGTETARTYPRDAKPRADRRDRAILLSNNGQTQAEQLREPSISRTLRHRPTLGSGRIPGAVRLLNRCFGTNSARTYPWDAKPRSDGPYRAIPSNCNGRTAL